MVEFTPKQLEQVLDFLDHSVCTYASDTEPYMVEVDMYVKTLFYPAIRDLLAELEKGGLK